MIKNAAAFFTVAVAGIASASAQTFEQKLHRATDAWTVQTGIYVPVSVRQHYFREMTTQVAATVDKFGGSSNVLATIQSHTFGKADTTAIDKAAVANQMATTHNVGLWLQKFPTIRVIVQPTPPKEFLLTINGEACPATEKAMYRVPAGTVTVRVWRQGSPVCEKTHNTSPGSTYDVACTF